jgi:hypothetical protein
LLLALVFAGINITNHVQTNARQNAWRGEISALTDRLTEASTTQGAQSTYELFDERFRENVKIETFERIMARMQFVKSATIGDLVVFESDEAGTTTATTLLVLEGRQLQPDGTAAVIQEPIEFRRNADGQWRIASIKSWFGQTTKAPVPDGTVGS